MQNEWQIWTQHTKDYSLAFINNIIFLVKQRSCPIKDSWRGQGWSTTIAKSITKFHDLFRSWSISHHCHSCLFDEIQRILMNQYTFTYIHLPKFRILSEVKVFRLTIYCEPVTCSSLKLSDKVCKLWTSKEKFPLQNNGKPTHWGQNIRSDLVFTSLKLVIQYIEYIIYMYNIKHQYW